MDTERRTLWWALVAFAVGAAMLHFRIHPPNEGIAFFWGNAFAFVDLIVVSLLFLRRGTAVYALLLNSFIAILGMVMMADFAISATLAGKAKVMPGEDLFRWFLQTTFPDITILFGDFLVGQTLYRVIMRKGPASS